MVNALAYPYYQVLKLDGLRGGDIWLDLQAMWCKELGRLGMIATALCLIGGCPDQTKKVYLIGNDVPVRFVGVSVAALILP